MEFRQFNNFGYWKYQFLDIHVYDISRASISISFGVCWGEGVGGAEPTLPETKNELHLGAEHASFIVVQILWGATAACIYILYIQPDKIYKEYKNECLRVESTHTAWRKMYKLNIPSFTTGLPS